MSREEDLNRLQHMIEATQEILDYVQGRDLSSLGVDRPLQHLIVHDLEILGEAASRLSLEFREGHPDIYWRDMIDLRNRLIHVYFDLNLAIIWTTVQQDLPQLLLQLKAILSLEQ
ncbi:MAG TPA: DUF86 domain-containing protein [Candidatus Hydrogenedentes bacterium]|nr:DUF86 domain-containing protein [Candidatus Hydrogenedentota bacterium]